MVSSVTTVEEIYEITSIQIKSTDSSKIYYMQSTKNETPETGQARRYTQQPSPLPHLKRNTAFTAAAPAPGASHTYIRLQAGHSKPTTLHQKDSAHPIH